MENNTISAEINKTFSSTTNVANISAIETQEQADRFLRVALLSEREVQSNHFLIQYLPAYTSFMFIPHSDFIPKGLFWF